jgi:hypothetical protein
MIDTIYTEEGWFGPEDYHDGTILCTRWLSFSESQLFLVDAETGKAEDLTKKSLYNGGFFTSDGRVVTQTSAALCWSRRDSTIPACSPESPGGLATC